MNYEVYGNDTKRSASFMLSIDFDALHLSYHCVGTDAIEQTYASLSELEEAYRQRVAPTFVGGACVDADGDRVVEPIEDFDGFIRELRACGYDWQEEPHRADDPLELFVAERTTQIRRELNRALGPAQTTLQHVVLMVGDMYIKPAFKDPPALQGLSAEEIDRLVGEGENSNWTQGETLDFAMSHEGWPAESIASLWSDPWEYGPWSFLGALLDLVAARIEANPRLRSGVSIPGTLRIFTAFREMEFVLLERRKRARAFANGSALEYFEQCSRERPG